MYLWKPYYKANLSIRFPVIIFMMDVRNCNSLTQKKQKRCCFKAKGSIAACQKRQLGDINTF